MKHFELAEVLANTDIEEEVPRIIFGTYGIDASDFDKLIDDLLPLIQAGRSPLTNVLYKGFASNGCWLSKVDVQNETA